MAVAAGGRSTTYRSYTTPWDSTIARTGSAVGLVHASRTWVTGMLTAA
jgi:hypothetical protein